MRRVGLFACASLGALIAANPAAGQSAGSGAPTAGPQEDVSGQNDLGAIVVTARLREEALQDVPVSVSALTSTDLSRQALDDLQDIADKVVGFSFEQLSGPFTQPAIRGQFNLRVDSPVQNVATYLNGIYLQRNYFIDQQLLEVQRVEIIKGPQSALYGRNAFAGVINLVARAPSLTDLEAKASGTVGSDERYDVRGMVSVPIVRDHLAVLGQVAYSEFDGTWRNNHPLADAGLATNGNLGGWRREAYQMEAIWKPSPALSFDALYVHTKRFLESAPSYTIGTRGILNPSGNQLNCSPVADLTPPFALQNRLFCGKLEATPTLLTGERRLPGLVVDPRAFGLKGTTDIVSAVAEWSPAKAVSFRYQFGYTRADLFGRGSVARDPLVPVTFAGQNLGSIFDSSGSGSGFEGFSHELRVTYDDGGPVNGFIGFNHSRTIDQNSNASESAPVNSTVEPSGAAFFPIGPGLPFPNGLFQRNTFLERRENIFSAFAFLSWDVTDRLILTAEGRVTWEDQVAIDFLTRQPGNSTIQALVPPRFSNHLNFFAPRGTATYKFTPRNMVYVSAGKGVKSGGLNGNTPFVGQREYGTEENWTYEIGTKNTFGRLTVNAAAYYTDWSNLQTTVVRLGANGLPPAFFAIVPSTIGNVGGVEIYGAEIEGAFRLTDRASLNFGASYNRARYTEDSVSQRFGASGNCDGVICQSVPAPGLTFRVLPIGGNQLERVPEFDALAGLTIDYPLSDQLTLRGRIDGTYQTKYFVDEANLAFVPDRWLASASAGVTWRRLDLNFWVKNLLDAQYVTSSFFLIGTGGALSGTYTPIPGERRTLGLTATVSY